MFFRTKKKPQAQYEDPLAQAVHDRYGEVNVDILIETEMYMAWHGYGKHSISAGLEIYRQLKETQP